MATAFANLELNNRPRPYSPQEPHYATFTLRQIDGLTYRQPALAPYCLTTALEAKKQEILKRSRSVTWPEVKERITARTALSQPELSSALRRVVDLAKRMAGDETEETLKAAALFLIETFLAKRIQDVEVDEKRKLRSLFPAISIELFDEARNVVDTLLNSLPENEQKNLLRKETDNELLMEPFSKRMTVSRPQSLNATDVPTSSDDEDTPGAAAPKFKLSQHEQRQPAAAINGAAPVAFSNRTIHDRAWLTTRVSDFCENSNMGLSVGEIVDSILSYINCCTIQELQHNLFGLLGCERVELIEEVIRHKTELISSSQPCGERRKERKPSALERLTNAQPGCVPVKNWVVVQTEKEKKLQKQIRKGMRRNHQNGNAQEEAAPKLDLQKEYAQQQRMFALVEARSAPLFRTLPPAVQYQEKYPFVFDALSEAKVSTAYIAGNRFFLPHDIEKSQTNEYEEIKVPPKLKKDIPQDIKDLRIKVADMDEVCQKGFEGIEKLNLIQSVIFKKAYESNENLLVCAPTGAGKTNVALLTILRCIKQHMERNLVQKDKFKIVYIAPMKALASEMVSNFSARLKSLNIVVKELTGDMQLTKNEIMQTQIIVTTPEKWDVVTRKATGDISLAQLVRLLILDEVHLLHGDRGPVLEAVIARTLRLVESSQTMIRIVGLSATLPNYIDVANFLRVNPKEGLFFFDDRFRPVPLVQRFIGVKGNNTLEKLARMDEVCYDKVRELVRNNHQVMVFVHARNSTLRTANFFKTTAIERGHMQDFLVEEDRRRDNIGRVSPRLRELFDFGFGIHHAGMLRAERNLVEKLFREGRLKVLCCTSTLAWGVNLPAYAVIIKGTEIYDAKHGKFVDIGILDVLQIFGRAGRPQYEKEGGQGIILTAHDKLAHYLSLLTNQIPIESQFVANLVDNLNAEISLGTVTNIDEAVEWLSYTYLFVRMRKNPLVYGLKQAIVERDPHLFEYRQHLIMTAAADLDKAGMIRYDSANGFLCAVDKGRVASHYYLKHNTVQVFNEEIKPSMTETEVLGLISKAEEFEQLKVREDEIEELLDLLQNACQCPIPLGVECTEGKVNALIQASISNYPLQSFSLISDQCYIIQNATRICRSLFEICLKQNNALMTSRFLATSKMLEHKMWHFDHPLKQFSTLKYELMPKLANRRLSLENLREMRATEIGQMVNDPRSGRFLKECAMNIPQVELDYMVQPITQEVLRITVTITPDFQWTDAYHQGQVESFWLWICNPEDHFLHHSESFLLTKKQVKKRESQTMVFTIPITDPWPTQYLLEVVSDCWLGSSVVQPISFQHLILPESYPPHTNLLNLDPLPVKALQNTEWESIYRFSHFNPIQTQVFHTFFHTDHNVLVGAPTGSGKTVMAELAFFRIFKQYPGTKIVYIAPLKALVKERIKDWSVRMQKRLGKKVVELTGDFTPDVRSIMQSDIIVTTPEKWDGVSRSWQTRNYVKAVSLIVIDEIHLLGEDRGPVLEVIVSRTNFIGASTQRNLRIIGLSTALANSRDLADWLRISKVGVYNFRSTVRPVPLEIHVSGYPNRHYCPRMALMNKPTFQAIKTHSSEKPALVFVSSRRQTRLTALDLIAYLAAEDNPRQWLHMSDSDMEQCLETVRDQNLKLVLAFGIGLHHAGLQEKDRVLVERLFLEMKIQVLIATATLAWGVNLPAHLVVIKGTEYYDGKTNRYVDFPITDVLQMAGRAGRPQFDNEGVAVVLVHDVKKPFYMKFLNNPFPVESSLLSVLPDHLNAEIVAGTIQTKQQCLDYLTWTYFFRRLLKNPMYYGYNKEEQDLNKFLSSLVDRSLAALERAYCIQMGEDERGLEATVSGKIASYYYLHHTTLEMFRTKLTSQSSLHDLMLVLCDAHEYAEFPVRHNEDITNRELAGLCPLPVRDGSYDSPHTKAFILLQAHFSRLPLPVTDYITDQKSVLDQAIRILQAIVDVCSDQGWLPTTLRAILLLQMLLQALWHNNCPLLSLPHIDSEHLPLLRSTSRDDRHTHFTSLPLLVQYLRWDRERLALFLRSVLEEFQIDNIHRTLKSLPMVEVHLSLVGTWEGSLQEESRPVPTLQPTAGPFRDRIVVHADQQYQLRVDLRRTSSIRPRNDTKALAPKFPKPKEEGWFLVLGQVERKELCALKRCPYLHRSATHKLHFYTPPEMGNYDYTLYLLSDSYLGLDQQYDIHLAVTEPALSAPLTTEILLSKMGTLSDSDTSEEES